ncbi:MAG: SDR family NAD(P)-dependent oxidoreductase [Clostridia bacterium]|nr:SDR family NAD(P)-dependent oxidoreductase [Clostridia bacterium]
MNNALVVGGNSGLGLSIAKNLLGKCDHVYIVGKDEPNTDDISACYFDAFKEKTTFFKLNLIKEDFSVFDEITDINTLVITAGFGRIALFEDLTEAEVANLLKVNCDAAIRIIKKYYSQIKNVEPFYTAVIGSIAGHVASPFFSVYGAAKAALCHFVENINAELMSSDFENRILDVSPGSLNGTAFNGEANNLDLIDDVSCEIINQMYGRKTLYIPKYKEIYENVIKRYTDDPIKFSAESYRYKMESGRVSSKPQTVIGYLSGTFDLFHIGHLNLLRRAKEQCDYLIVGVHASGSWKGKQTFIPFEERCEIIKSVRYVDEVIESPVEDSDAWDMLHYDKLFVGSDYKGSERFERYEKYLEGRAKIVYFSYTTGTSSTQLRDALSKK